MKTILRYAGRMAATLCLVSLAALVSYQLWNYYMNEPWTRDGHVRAEIVGVTPDVSGLVAQVLVRDNQKVHRGDVLFRLDRARFVIALQQAEAVVASRAASLRQARDEAWRYDQLDDRSVSRSHKEQADANAAVAVAALEEAVADRNLAALNLERSVIHASADGIVTNLRLRPGDFVSAGTPVIALVDAETLHVEGYFEETKLAHIHKGDPVRIHLMGERGTLRGHVESIYGGIADRERTDGDGLLANVNPTFTWVRLAQRIPVRIAIDSNPEGAEIIPGRTATVAVEGHPQFRMFPFHIAGL